MWLTAINTTPVNQWAKEHQTSSQSVFLCTVNQSQLLAEIFGISKLQSMGYRIALFA